MPNSSSDGVSVVPSVTQPQEQKQPLRRGTVIVIAAVLFIFSIALHAHAQRRSSAGVVPLPRVVSSAPVQNLSSPVSVHPAEPSSVSADSEPSASDAILTEAEHLAPRQNEFDAGQAAASPQRKVKRSRFLAHKAAPEQRGLLDALSPKRPDAFHGIYVAGRAVSNPDIFSKYIDSLTRAHATAIVILVKAGTVYFQTEAPLARQIRSIDPQYELPAVVKAAKDRGLYVIARFVALNDGVLAARHPDAQIKGFKSRRPLNTEWVDGAHPFTLSYNKELIADIARSGIDEINLDYIRSPTDVPMEAIGLTGREKADHIEAFLRMARQTIDTVNPDVKLGISTYAILGWNFPVNFEHLGQDIARFAPLVDVISPMAYPSTFSMEGGYVPQSFKGSRNYYLVYQTLRGYQKLLDGDPEGKLRPWLQGYSMKPEGVRQQIQAVYDAGVCGFTVWNANNNYQESFDAFKRMPERPIECI